MAVYIVTFITLALWVSVLALRRRHVEWAGERRRKTVEEYSRWKCPDCDKRFGEEAISVEYGTAVEFETSGGEFIPRVVIVCPHCRRLNLYDAKGVRLCEPGERFEIADEEWASIGESTELHPG